MTRRTLVVALLVTVAVGSGACTISDEAGDGPKAMSRAGGGSAGTSSSQAGSTNLGLGGQEGDGGHDAGSQPATWDISSWDDGSYFAP
ncbi:MAG: hypothetical protein ABUL60_20480 [Myxococcales bacterium]